MINPIPPIVRRGLEPIPVIPTVYTDALSYGEQTGIMIKKIDECVDKVNEVVDDNNDFKTELTNQQNTFETNITNQQNTFETNITNRQNTYETNLTNRQNTWEQNTTDSLNSWKNTTSASYQAQITQMDEDYTSFLNTYQREFGVANRTGYSETDAITQNLLSRELINKRINIGNLFDKSKAIIGKTVDATGAESVDATKCYIWCNVFGLHVRVNDDCVIRMYNSANSQVVAYENTSGGANAYTVHVNATQMAIIIDVTKLDTFVCNYGLIELPLITKPKYKYLQNTTQEEYDNNVISGKNKLNSALTVNGEYFNNHGNYKTDSNWCYTVIPIKGGTLHTVPKYSFITYFSEYNVKISTITNGTAEATSNTAPSNTSFMTVSMQKTWLPTAQVEFGTATGTPFEPYGTKLKYGLQYKERTGKFEHFTVSVNQNTPLYYNSDNVYLTDNENDLVDVQAILGLPDNYNPTSSKKTPLIMICHGAGYRVTADTWGATNDETTNASASFRVNIVDRFLAMGYAVCDINGYNNDLPCQTWGCPRTVYAYRKLYDYIVQNYNVQKEIFIYGFSMGGIVSLNFTLNNRDIVKHLGIGAPVVGLWDTCWNTQYGATTGWRKSSAQAFDFQGIDDVTFTKQMPPTAEETAFFEANKEYWKGYDPNDRIVEINSDNYFLGQLPTVQIWVGSTDTAIDITPINKLVGAIQNAGGRIWKHIITGGHEICYGGSTVPVFEFLYMCNRYCVK